MEPRNLELRKQDTTSYTFNHRLRVLKESMKDCYIFETAIYAINGSKRQRYTAADTHYGSCSVTALDEYYWLRKSKSDTFYGLGRFRDNYMCFVFRYDDIKESSKLKITYATSREVLIEHAMSPRIYERYIKDTTPL